jgi:hypothetical protein
MIRLAVGMAHPERAIVVHPVETQLIIFVEVVFGCCQGRCVCAAPTIWVGCRGCG